MSRKTGSSLGYLIQTITLIQPGVDQSSRSRPNAAGLPLTHPEVPWLAAPGNHVQRPVTADKLCRQWADSTRPLRDTLPGHNHVHRPRPGLVRRPGDILLGRHHNTRRRQLAPWVLPREHNNQSLSRYAHPFLVVLFH